MKIDGRIIGEGHVGPVTRRLQSAFSKLTEESGVPIPTYQKAWKFIRHACLSLVSPLTIAIIFSYFPSSCEDTDLQLFLFPTKNSLLFTAALLIEFVDLGNSNQVKWRTGQLRKRNKISGIDLILICVFWTCGRCTPQFSHRRFYECTFARVLTKVLE